MRSLLQGGFYQTRSLIADAQRCLNLYPEGNAGQSQSPVTHYPTPGLVLLGTAPNGGPIRGGYTATNGNQYVVSGNTLYKVTLPSSFTSLGSLTTSSGQVSFADNGTDMILVDGSATGFRISLALNTFAQITDAGFSGGDRVAYADGYFVLNIPNTRQWYVSDVQASTFPTLNFASKEGGSDMLQTIGVVHREVWLFGESTVEVYFDSGDVYFPYQRMPGVFIQNGCAAKHSLSQFGLSFFWLGKNPQGNFIVFQSKGYQEKRISTHAIEHAISQYSAIDDAIGAVYQQEGHAFYVLTFPSADATWVYDITTELWHERAAMDSNGQLHRILANCFWTNGLANLVGDYRNGNIYQLDLNTYTDNGTQILRLRSFPTILDNDSGHRINYSKIDIDIETGVGLTSGTWANPSVSLRWSDDGGYTWGNPVVISLGALADKKVRATLRRLGIARRRVFELSWAAPVATALNGAWIDAAPLGS